MPSKDEKKRRLTQKEQLRAEYKRLAKAADRRLRNLEALAKEDDFKDATNWAYARAMSDIEHRWGEGSDRFDRKLPKDWKITSMIAAINEVKTFMQSPSSTKRGIIDVYKSRVETLMNAKDEYTGEKLYGGVKLTWQQAAKLFEDNTFDKLLGKMTSAQIWKQIAKRQRRAKELIKAIQKSDKKIIKDSTDRALYKQLKSLMDDGTVKPSDNQIFDAVLNDMKRISNRKKKLSINELA